STSPANGTWKLKVEDRSTGGVGTLKSWSLTF
ncbi:proprotein convertase P-domain-containing protein, partial [Streptomyces sp. NPDC058632]